MLFEIKRSYKYFFLKLIFKLTKIKQYFKKHLISLKMIAQKRNEVF